MTVSCQHCGGMEIPLQNAPGQHFICDPEDYPRFSYYRWWLSRNGYAKRYHGGQIRYAHRLAMGASKIHDGARRYIVDHIDSNRLHNCKHNLRLADRKENGGNMQSRGGSSRYKGVYWNTRDGRWQVQVHFEYGTIYVGQFRPEPDAHGIDWGEVAAALAYDSLASELFRQYARTNFRQEALYAVSTS
jgi:hypothetical protein